VRQTKLASSLVNFWVHNKIVFDLISVTVEESTQDRTVRAFIPAILLNLSLRHCDSTFWFRDLELKSLHLRRVIDDSNTN